MKSVLNQEKQLVLLNSDGCITLDELLFIYQFDGTKTPFPVKEMSGIQENSFKSYSKDFLVEANFNEKKGLCDYLEATYKITYRGEHKEKIGINITGTLDGCGNETWMIPGLFYKKNSQEGNTRKYPQFSSDTYDPYNMVSNFWSFRSDRMTTPLAIAWNEQMSAAFAVNENSPVGQTGLGFGYINGTAKLFVNFPYREEPITYVGNAIPEAADITFYEIHPGEQITISFKVFIGTSNPHEYNLFLRQLYNENQKANPLHPWMTPKEAADYTAHGLFTWHYKKDLHILCETAAFDRELNNNVKELGDRLHMHVGWVSGIPYAYALLNYGRNHNQKEYIDAAQDVINFISEGISPSGYFWASWTIENGWGTGWNPHKNWLHARTISEATLFLIRSGKLERQSGVIHEKWDKAILSNLKMLLTCQNSSGNFGSYYNCETGEVTEWQGAGGILWIATLCEAASYFQDTRYLSVAQKAAAYYQKFVENEYIFGAPEDVHFTPTSEDAYNAVVSYVLLYEATHNKRWLSIAKKAADWMMTFRWSYNISFSKQTFLSQYDYRTRGADQASPSNQHLHNYGLFCLPEMIKLYEYTEDKYYLDRTKDNLACFLQFVAREDGDFNAYKGMVTERVYHTNCFQRKGMMLTLSHSWCVGLVLYASQVTEHVDLFKNLI